MTYESLLTELHAEFPSFRLEDKRDSKLMRLFNFLVWFFSFGRVDNFMTGYATTIGYTVYVPEYWDLLTAEEHVKVLRHERVHLRQQRKYTRPLYFFLYAFVFLPIGLAYFRAKFEKEAYEETMRCWFEEGGLLLVASRRSRVVAHFSSAVYGFMWPFRRRVESWFDDTLERISKEAIERSKETDHE